MPSGCTGWESLLPGDSPDEQEKRALVMEYFRLGEEEQRLERMAREAHLALHGSSPAALDEDTEELRLVQGARGANQERG